MDQNQRSNEIKAKVDQGARDILQPNIPMLAATARKVGQVLRAERRPMRIVVLGGAASGKSTFSRLLSKELDIPVFDLDVHIPGGWVPDKKQYEKNFLEGLDALWPKVPVNKEWIIEHVRSADPELLERFKPAFAILVERPKAEILATAKARDAAAQQLGQRATDGSRQMRALDSRKEAAALFERISGERLPQSDPFWRVKLLD